LVIGLEVFAISWNGNIAGLGAAAIGLVLLGRLLAVTIPITALRRIRTFSPGVIPIMTWGGLKGGISVALVLSLPDSEWKPLLVSVTYIVVVFSILVQGLTIGRVVRRFAKAAEG
ncbi:MAG: cation:proton antiporter, partial [Alphaproteobacteria bacterium]